MGTMIPFPRLLGNGVPRDAQQVADAAMCYRVFSGIVCSNGMPGHPPCRSIEELNELLRRREAAGEIA